jgi:putative ABC transport system permease protein
MKMTDTIRRAGRSLRHAKARTLLTSLAIGVGAFTITLSLAAGAGGRQYTEDLISANTDVHELRVMQKQESGAATNTPKEYKQGASSENIGNGFQFKQLSQNDIDKIEKTSGVKVVEPVYTLNAQYVTRASQKKYDASLSTFNQSVSQQYLAGSVSGLDKNSVLITEEYRKVLGFSSNQDAIGKTVDLAVGKSIPSANPLQPLAPKLFTLTVAAVYKSSALSFSNGTSLQVLPEMAKELYTYNMEGAPGYGTYFAATVRTDPDISAESVKADLSAMGYDVQTAKDLMSTLFSFINVLQGILLGFGALAVLTSIFGIINTQYISVLERTSQIGLMKALGMRRRDVGRLFKFEAAWIGFLGGAIGSGLAFIAGTLGNPVITKALELQEGTTLLIFQPLSMLVVIIGLMLISVGAGILPARKAAKLDPIEALRTE